MLAEGNFIVPARAHIVAHSQIDTVRSGPLFQIAIARPPACFAQALRTGRVVPVWLWPRSVVTLFLGLCWGHGADG